MTASMGPRGCARRHVSSRLLAVVQMSLYLFTISAAALPSVVPIRHSASHTRRHDTAFMHKRIINDPKPTDNTRCFADTSYSGWAMILQFQGDTYDHVDVSGANNGATQVVDIPNCRDLPPDKFNGLNVQTWAWNTDDSYRQPCQVFWLKGLPGAKDGDTAFQGAFSMSPNGKNTTLALASTQNDGWKPTLKPPGLPEQTYQIMCDACYLDPKQLEGQMYLGTTCAISIRTTTDVSVWTAQAAGQPILSMPYVSSDPQYFNILKIDSSGKPLIQP